MNTSGWVSLIGLVILPVVSAWLVWLIAGQLGQASRTARVLHIATFLVAICAGLAGVSLAGNTVRVLQTVTADADQRSISVPVEWYSHVAIIDLVREGTKSDRATARNLPRAVVKENELDDRAHATHVSADARIPRPSQQQILLWSLYEIAVPLVALVAFVLLTIALESARKGDPFGSRASRSLMMLGFWLLLMFPMTQAISVLLSEVVTNGDLEWYGTPPKSTSTLLVFPWLPGLGVLALATVFKRGQELQDADRLTV